MQLKGTIAAQIASPGPSTTVRIVELPKMILLDCRFTHTLHQGEVHNIQVSFQTPQEILNGQSWRQNDSPIQIQTMIKIIIRITAPIMIPR